MQDVVKRPGEGDAQEYQLIEVGEGVRLRKGTREALMKGLQYAIQMSDHGQISTRQHTSTAVPMADQL